MLDNIPVISIGDLKNITEEQNETSIREDKICKLKHKIDSIVKDGQYDFDDVFRDHNYCNTNSTVFECIVYFLTG